ncbi:hypothetical protein [Nannocystis pusilla]|uniref:hypothetical protein n=1 Tax=Nannocystis pusilla TaxID=889268 RepID=UPI003DA3D017
MSFSYQGEVSTLSQFYPKVKIEGVRHGIVLSQDCDLAWKKLPYITIGFLEPISRYIQRDKNWSGARLPWNLELKGEKHQFILVSPEYLLSNLKQKLTTLLKNEEPYHFFVRFENEAELEYRYCVVNLTKSVPIRMDHYDAIREKVACQLDTPFARKLGWKFASLYGRVGTEDPSEETLKLILGDLRETVDEAVSAAYPNPISINTEDFKRSEKLKDSGWPEKQRHIIRLLEKYGAQKPEFPTTPTPVLVPNAVQALAPSAEEVKLGKATETVLAVDGPKPEDVAG